MKSKGLLVAILLLATLVYLPGLSGPFLFDDAPNLRPVQQWSDGQTPLLDVVFGNDSGTFGRPIAMLSFIASASLLGTEPSAFKTGNLVIHLISGLLLFLLLVRIERRQNAATNAAMPLALVATAIWLLHPMLASTVLYSVQRMAMLSSMFMLAAILLYVVGRERIERGASRTGSVLLFGVVPLVIALATLSKENGILALWLCILIEWTFFQPAKPAPRPLPARIFMAVFGALPLVGAVTLLLLVPERLLGDYENRPFTAFERLLTQTRVLWDYVGGIVLPNGARYSLFRDDYIVSTGLLEPATTAWALLGWAVVVGLAIRLRRSVPGFSFGIAFFLVAHSMESSVLPLLIYFEHRNYLPGIGLIWALLSLLQAAAPYFVQHLSAPRKMAVTAAVLLLVALSAATFGRSLVWQSEELLLKQSLERYPDSRHARMALAEIEMNRLFPNLDAASAHYQHLRELDRASTRMIGTAGLLAAQCHATGQADPDSVGALFDEAPEAIEADFLRSATALREILERRECSGLSLSTVGERLATMLDRAHLPANVRPVWQMRFEAARIFSADGQSNEALSQAELAWVAGNDENVGLFLLELRISSGDFAGARALATELDQRLRQGNEEARSLLQSYLDILSIVDPRASGETGNP